MSLEPALIEYELVDGTPIARAVLLGGHRIPNVEEAAVSLNSDEPLSVTLKVLVQDVRSVNVSKGTHLEVPGLPGRMCTVGETPALGYTVGELIDRLSQYPRDAPVGMNVGPGSNLEILSLYRATEPPEVVWFDLGEKEDD